MLNRELEVTLNLAFKEARAKRHEFMTVEHLLLALLDNEAAASVLRACGANLDKLPAGGFVLTPEEWRDNLQPPLPAAVLPAKNGRTTPIKRQRKKDRS